MAALTAAVERAAPEPIHVRERPVHRDPLAEYDHLNRKQLKRIGFVEVLRTLPWLLRGFQAEVPGEFFAVDGNVATIACPCKADPPPAAPFNVVTRCEGEDCRRWFFYDGSRVLVARGPVDEDLGEMGSAPSNSTARASAS